MFHSSTEAVSGKKGLDQMISNIVQTVQPEKIFCRNDFFLIVISGRSQKPLSEYKTVIDATGMHSLFHYAVCTADVLAQHLINGDLFYSTLCIPCNLVYDCGARILPLPMMHRARHIQEKASHDFMAGFNRALAFLNGAAFHQANEEHAMAAFMLHQAAEQCMRAMLLSVLGQDVKTHTLADLKQVLKKYGLAVNALSCAPTEREQYLFDRLEKAYVCARYTDCFEITQDDIFQLHPKIKSLLQELKYSFESFLNQFMLSEAHDSRPINLAS